MNIQIDLHDCIQKNAILHDVKMDNDDWLTECHRVYDWVSVS